jgi:hypothetical protein
MTRKLSPENSEIAEFTDFQDIIFIRVSDANKRHAEGPSGNSAN